MGPWEPLSHCQTAFRLRVRFERTKEPTGPGTLRLEEACHSNPYIAAPTFFWSSAPDLAQGCHPGLPPFQLRLMGPPTHKTVSLFTRLAEGNPKKTNGWSSHGPVLEKVVLEYQTKCVKNQAQGIVVWTWALTLSMTEVGKKLCCHDLKHTLLTCWLEANSAPQDSGGSVPVFLFLSWSLFPSLCLVFSSSLARTYPSLSIKGSQIQGLPCLCLISSKKSVKKNPSHNTAEC